MINHFFYQIIVTRDTGQNMEKNYRLRDKYILNTFFVLNRTILLDLLEAIFNIFRLLPKKEFGWFSLFSPRAISIVS